VSWGHRSLQKEIALHRPPSLRAAGLAAAVALVAALAVLAAPANAAPAATQRYIVTLTGAANPAAVARAQTAAVGAAGPARVFSHALRGYVADLTAAQASRIAANPNVAAIELDGVMSLVATQSNPPSYGIDRVDQRNLPLSATYTYTSTGSGVRAYIIDTGIRATHQDLAGRVVAGTNTVDASPSTTDCNGHGTHVSGTVGGTTYGIAKGVTLVAVRTFGCGNSTATSAIIAGVDWATGNHQAGQPAVANMSLGGGASTALDTAVRNLIADGVSVSIAAGNGNLLGMPENSCSVSPARVTEGITVGASDQNDAKASFSNYGTCVDLHAPGVNIVSAGIASDSASATLSGTSMACPHVVGVSAQYLAANPGATPAQVQTAIKNLSTKGVVTGTGGGLLGGSTPNNHLLFTNL
jgi:subtilisin family serine protease